MTDRQLPYRDFSAFISAFFSCKMQKLTVNAGLGCPNRDGTVGRGGCTYCNNQSFNPAYCREIPSITEQLLEGKRFFSRKYPSMRYLAYFQAYTGSHGNVDKLISLYHEALDVEGIDGIIIGTRPDCMPPKLLEELSAIRKHRFVMIEYGAESSHDTTLNIINRCHTWQCTVDAVKRTSSAGIPVGLHLIMGLPQETERHIMETIDAVNDLPVNIIKCHQLQLIRGTVLAAQVHSKLLSVPQFTVDSYIDLCCKIIRRLRPDIAIERFVSQSPDSLLISPRWGLKNHEFTDRLLKRLRQS